MPTIHPPALKPYLTVTLWQEFLKQRKGGIKKMKKLLFGFLILGFAVSASAQTPQVPHLLNFQSVLTDAAGSPLPDGMYDVDFQIVDAQAQVLYTETQTLEVAQGAVSAMVGAQGLLDLSLLDPQTPKFLSVRVASQGPEKLMEIATVPYALYAQQALGAAPQSIGGEAIQSGVITAEHLAEDVLNTLLGNVENNFFYSQSSSVPTVLRDLDIAVHQRQVNLDSARVQLQNNIDTEQSTRQAADQELQNAMDAEQLQRGEADTGLQNQITAVSTNLQGQISAIDTSVSASQSATDSRLATAEQNIDTCLASPRVMAAGILNNSGGRGPSIELGHQYNVSRVEAVEGGVRVYFQDGIAPPYFVLTNPDTDPTSFAADSFVLAGALINSYHFVVFQ